MKTEVFSRFDQPWMPALAFLLFFGVFIAALWVTLRPKRFSYCDYMSKLPLGGDQEGNQNG